LSSKEILQLDADYRGFPDFDKWPSVESSDAGLWDYFVGKLQTARQEQSQEEFAAASELRSMRAAAFDTGAVEGL